MQILAGSYASSYSQEHRVLTNMTGTMMTTFIWHACAFNMLADKVVLDGEDLTLTLIVNAHRILFEGIELAGEEFRGETYEDAIAAHYGTQKQSARLTKASSVKQYIAKLFEDLRNEILQAKGPQRIDSYDTDAQDHVQLVDQRHMTRYYKWQASQIETTAR